ncbi:MAG: RNA polymerase sigma factor [Planctomycetota bacterium]|nr:MAG: RNA polymerase sigma factor [Planctomycetota bacterium]
MAAQSGGEKRVAKTLAEQLAAGDPEAFAALYDRLAVRLFNTARTMTDSLPDAEDTVHDVFVELARSRDRLARITDLDAYIFTMLRHAISRRRRRRDVDRRAIDTVARQRVEAGRFATQPAELPDDALTAAVAGLPPAQREVLALKVDGGLTFAEIAAVIGTSINTAASRYRYAIETIRATITHPEAIR